MQFSREADSTRRVGFLVSGSSWIEEEGMKDHSPERDAAAVATSQSPVDPKEVTRREMFEKLRRVGAYTAPVAAVLLMSKRAHAGS
jgi:hypothetical protein